VRRLRLVLGGDAEHHTRKEAGRVCSPEVDATIISRRSTTAVWGAYAPATLRQPSHRFFIHIACSLTDLSNPSVIQSVRMLFCREDFEPRTASKTQEVLMESDGVVFIDGALIEDGAL
jgi:hypothetical protein